ncbi:hypothetical protein AMK59_559 [Oryctes borbonicus]|uniref:ZNFX1 domain-containing protein n=1 Tax=Oryctes borbonicus TaxID=1629725 RepID=A0A0T6BHA2_9SCAR|nr:hypothetical protein AMK59_559 [Oryctes borbonicus]
MEHGQTENNLRSKNRSVRSSTNPKRNKNKTRSSSHSWRSNHQQDGVSGNRNRGGGSSSASPSTRVHPMGRGRSSNSNSCSKHNKNNTINYNRPYRIGFKKLEEFLNEEPDQLIVKLLSASAGFSELIHSPNLSPDYIVLIMKVISRMSESTFTSNKTKILEKATPDDFLNQLTQFIINLPLQNTNEQRRAQYFWNDQDAFFKNVNNYCDMILTLSPTTALEILKKLLKASLIVIQHFNISTDTGNMMKKIEEKLITYEEEFLSRYRRKDIVTDEDESEPPDDFRSISLYPLPAEITNRTKAFVRKNIIEGAYRNVDHYLDIQFRLLREDFVKPLREGICDYKENKKIQNIRIYQNVTVLGPYMVNSICGVLIQLPMKNSTEFKRKIENSRRFMFGSLVCFTSNNFRSLTFGKIIDRKPELLHKGQLVIGFDAGVYEIDFEPQYLMIESSVYFEPYYHVLKALQQLREENFPMRKFIIEVNNETQRPRYLPPSTPPSSDYDSDSYERVIEMPRTKRMEVDCAKLNQAQYKAYQSAMIPIML